MIESMLLCVSGYEVCVLASVAGFTGLFSLSPQNKCFTITVLLNTKASERIKAISKGCKSKILKKVVSGQEVEHSFLV